MGLFSSSYKYFQSISFQPLKAEPFGEFLYSRRQFLFASDANSRIFGKEMWKWKNDYRKRSNDALAAKLNAQPELMPVEYNSYDAIVDYIKNTLEVDDFYSILHIYEKSNEILGEEFPEDEFPEAWQVVYQWLIWDGFFLWRFYDDEEDYYYYASQNTTEKVDDLYRVKVNNEYLSDSKAEAVLEYTLLYYEESEDEEGNVIIEEENQGDNVAVVDAKQWFYISVSWIDKTDGKTHTSEEEMLYIPYDIYTGSASEVENEELLEFAPIFQLKGDNEPVEVQLDQRRMLKTFGLSMDAVQGMIDNGDIDDFRIGYAVAPDDAVKSASIAKYLFEFFEIVGGSDFDGTIRPLGLQRNRTIKFSVGEDENELTVQISFNLEERTVDGQVDIPDGFDEYKVKLKQKLSNADIYYDDVKDVYDDAIGGSETDITAMYNAVVDAYNDNPDDYEEFYNRLPPSGYNRTSLIRKNTYAFSTPEDFDVVLFDELYFNVGDEDEPEYEQYWEIDSYKRYHTLKSSDFDGLYAQLIYDQNVEMLEDPETGELEESDLESVMIIIRKNISDTQYKEYVYRSGMLEYEIDGHTAKVYHDKADKTFRLFMLNKYLDRKRFREYTAVYDRSLCGLAYCQERVKVRWYERAWFGTFLQIVAIVITVYTAGAGAGISATLISMATTYAIAYVAMKLAEAIGGELGVLIGTIVAVTAMYFNPAGSGMSVSDIWLTTSDTYLKMESVKVKDDIEKMKSMYEEYKKEIDKYMYYIEQEMNYMDSLGYSKEAIIKNIANRAYNEGYTDVYFDIETVNSMEEEDWKLPEVKGVDYNLAETLYNQSTEIPKSVYEFEDRLYAVTRFGDENAYY